MNRKPDIKRIFKFLSSLKRNNNRDWFNEHKDEYMAAYEDFRILIHHIIKELGKVDDEIAILDPKKSIYRIYRDIRFSKDKTPYKTHFGAFLAPGGRTSGQAGYYLHLNPEWESFMGGGLYHPEREALAKVRQEIDYNGSELFNIVSNKSFKRFYSSIEGEKLTRAPKGYDPDHPNIELIKLKDFLVLHRFSDQEVLQTHFSLQIIKGFKIMKPFIDYLNVAIS